MTLWSLFLWWGTAGSPIWSLQWLAALVSVLLCVMVDLLHNRMGLPPGVHFILFGAGRKFNKTDWNPTPLVPLLVVTLLALTRAWLAMLAVTLLQVARAHRMFKKLT